ncbi:unnamed protein product, partial [Ixodes hexagonus]
SFILFAATVLLALRCSCASTPDLDRNPALQQFQNEALAFPLKKTWYIKYRNYETDPFFGGTAKCVRLTETNPGKDDVYPLVLQYNPDVSVDITVTLSSSPGYTAKNIETHYRQDKNISATAYTAYKDVKKCGVLRIPEVGADACVLLVPESQLTSNNTCCDFIFDLLCGTTPKFYIYDSSCA